MTKAESVEAVKKELGDTVTKSAIEKTLDALSVAFFKALRSGDSFALLGLGGMKVVSRAARQGRNPRTGAAIQIPARKAVKFTPSKTLKDAITEM